MNRLHHLKETLPKNIKDSLSYGNVEFVVLNYNSKDEMEEWIQEEMVQYIDMGILKYFKTNDPNTFLRSHSKNVAARCASGEIICNVDADNYIGIGFTEFINEMFNKYDNIFVATDINNSPRDCVGRICVKGTDFHNVKGYDEYMKGYGFEDEDLKFRLEKSSLKRIEINDFNFLKAINHDNIERIQNEDAHSKFYKILVRYIDYASSYILFLDKNKTYYLGIVRYNKLINSQNISNMNYHSTYRYSLLNDNWSEGEWTEKKNNEITLSKDLINFPNNNAPCFFHNGKSIYKVNGKAFFHIDDENIILELAMFFSEINNRNKMFYNFKNSTEDVNNGSYGKANLIKNFNKKLHI